MRILLRLSMMGVTSVALLGFVLGCDSSTNDPKVAGGEAAKPGPKDMKEWYAQNKASMPEGKGAAKSKPGTPAK